MNQTEEQEIKENWSSYWASKSGSVEEWDSLSQIIYTTLLEEAGTFSARDILEGGCGTGRISARILGSGGRVTFLDITEDALRLAREHSGKHPSARFVQASILDMPRDAQFDLVWNAGVLEHFVEENQRKIISELLAVLRPNGKLVIIVPYARSLPYRIGKFALENLGRWHYGREVPLVSLVPALPSNGRIRAEYTISFLPFVFDCYKFLPLLRPLCRPLFALLLKSIGERGLWKFDRALSRVFGGYLLVSVIEPVVGTDKK